MATRPGVAYLGIYEHRLVDGDGHITQPWYDALQALNARSNSSGDVSAVGDLTLNRLIVGNGGQDIRAEALNDGQIPIGATSDGTVTPATITGVAPVVVTNGPHTISISAPTAGSVTSVALTMPTEFVVAGSPITTSGTLAVTKATESANTVYAGPASGAAAQPTFRDLVTADFPASGVAAATYGDGTHVAQVTVDTTGRVTSASNVSITNQGTVTHTAGPLIVNELVVGNGSADIQTVAATDGQIPIGKSSDGSVTLATLTAGSNITITNAGGSITIAASGGSSTGGSTLIGLDRLLGDGSTTTFNLADLAEYVVDVSDAGSTVDPTLYSLSADLSQIIFGTAPTAGHVLTFEYVVAQLAA